MCIDPRLSGFVGKGKDHLQLIKFWPSQATGKGVCGGAKVLAPPYYSQRAVFASPLSAFFHIMRFYSKQTTDVKVTIDRPTITSLAETIKLFANHC